MSGKKPIGRPPKLKNPHGYLLRLPEPLHKQLTRLASRHGGSLNDLIVKVLSDWTERELGRERSR